MYDHVASAYFASAWLLKVRPSLQLAKGKCCMHDGTEQKYPWDARWHIAGKPLLR